MRRTSGGTREFCCPAATQNGEADAVIQDMATFEQTQEKLALLKLLALGSQDIAAGKSRPACTIVEELRSKTVAR